MDKYISTMLVEAKEMSLEKYKEHSGQQSKLDDIGCDGYYIESYGGYRRWMPKEIFDKLHKKMNMTTDTPKILEHDLITKENTYISHDDKVFNSPHNYIIHSTKKDEVLGCIHFQEGAIKENTLNGIFNEDLIAIVLDRLNNFQDSKFECVENEVAINHLEQALVALRTRTNDRKARGVQGKYEV